MRSKPNSLGPMPGKKISSPFGLRLQIPRVAPGFPGVTGSETAELLNKLICPFSGFMLNARAELSLKIQVLKIFSPVEISKSTNGSMSLKVESLFVFPVLNGISKGVCEIKVKVDFMQLCSTGYTGRFCKERSNAVNNSVI